MPITAYKIRGNRLLSFALSVFFALAHASVVLAAEVRVPTEAPTIQKGIEAAGTGGVVIIEEGSYLENVVISAPLTLKAAEGSTPIISAAAPDKPVILVSAHNVTIEGLTLKGSKVAGIQMSGSDNSVVAGNTALANTNGIMLLASNGNAIKDNVASANEVYGIYLEASHSNVITGNTTSKNLDKGIFLSYADKNSISENTANLNTWNGILLWSSHGNSIKDNSTLRNTYGIILSDSPDNMLEGNSSWPNIFLILPAFLLYIGIMNYWLQRTVLKLIYRQG